jgi:hypothetical protein
MPGLSIQQKLKSLSISLSILSLSVISLSQSSFETPLPAASATQAALKEWVQTRQLISRESAAWQEQQKTLEFLNEIRQLEIKNLEDFIQSAGDRVNEIDKQRAAYVDEEAELKAWRRELSGRITKLEDKLRPHIPFFPPPLRAKIQEAVIRFEEDQADRPLQHRARDVLLIMQAYQDFQKVITMDADIRLIDGKKREIEILYLGLTQAWFVDPSDRYAGYGLPTPEGWDWIEETSLAPSVRQAISILSREEAPAFISLPIANGTALKP